MNLKQISAHSEALDKLKKLQKARNEIAEKIENHPNPEEVPKLSAVLAKFNSTILELEKTVPKNLLMPIDPAGMVYKRLPGGRFEMGDKVIANYPPHQVTLQPFEMGKTLVTQEQWRNVLKNSMEPFFSSEKLKKNTDDHPMEQIGWRDAIKYCKRLSLLSEKITEKIKFEIKYLDMLEYLKYALENPQAKLYRLPTEAEWEYAAKAGRNYQYGTQDGNEPQSETAIFMRKEEDGTMPVTSTQPNKFGLHDMSGHLWQYTASWYDENFYKKGQHYQDPIGPKHAEFVVVKGGSWKQNSFPFPTASTRAPRSPSPTLIGDELPNDCGFRPVRYIDEDEQP